ncbi:MAG TPA: deoxyribose-phosphate aldolase [Gemmatimonadales bacterium]|nr:deoxyribose-phosphate aldolase [Gemmatimonadales bacterium]
MTLPPWLAEHADARGIGRMIDYTLLRPDAMWIDVARLCDEAVASDLIAVCVNGLWVRRCAERLAGTDVRLAAVVGFPLGAGSTTAKAAEAANAVLDGAIELDMVMPLGLAKAGEWTAVADDVSAVVEAAAGRSLVKVILETALLTPSEIVEACGAATRGGAAFVKTSTGFHAAGGATVQAVAAMRAAVGPTFGVKASGGIRSAEAALTMIAAGANRIGASNLAAFVGIVGPSAPSVADLVAAHAPA